MNILKICAAALLLLSFFFSPGCIEKSSPLRQQALWVGGAGGYHTYRIPAICVTVDGTVLAFCEGRNDGGGDSGNIDLLIRRSGDMGRTWSGQEVVWDDGPNTCGNPCPVVDQETGTVWLFSTWNLGQDHESEIIAGTSEDTRRIFVMSSDDNGRSWTKPREVTSAVKQPGWTWYATGPGSGIQIQRGNYAGRMVIACDHIEAETGHYYSHTVYSDDHGEHWQPGGSTPQHQVNECEVAELTDGRLLLNMRNYDRSRKNRQIAFSSDGGESWSGQQFDEALIEPICQASLERYSWPGHGEKSVLLFSNPASAESRINLTVRASMDEGKTWPRQLVLHSGPSAYSDLAVPGRGNVLCLYERGAEHPYEEIVLARFQVKNVRADSSTETK